VAVTISSRLAILGLGGNAPEPVSGALADLSVSGMGVRFSQYELGPALAALEDAVLTVELQLAPPEPALRLAGRVRRLDQEDETHTVLLGVEFVLLTDLDRARLLEAVDQSDEGQPRAATG
jgi:c-di-GMP-binding flagellar brake protein YcgR